MKNIDRLAVYKLLLRQPTLIAKDLTLNSTKTDSWRGKSRFQILPGKASNHIFFLFAIS